MATPGQKRVAIIVAIAGMLLVLAVVGVVVALRLIEPMVRREVVAQAKAYGVVILAIRELDYGRGFVRLGNTDFELEGVSGVRGTARKIEIALDGKKPTKLEVDGVELMFEGSAARLAFELSQWTRRHPEVYRLPVTAKNMRIGWSAPPGSKPWVVVEGGSLWPSPVGGRFEASRMLVEGVDTGKLIVTWIADQALVGLGLGSDDPKNAPVRLEVHHAAKPPTASITLTPMALERLSGPFGMALPIENVTVSGKADVVFVPKQNVDGLEGSALLELDGFVPPHPPELDGFVFGNKTTVTTKYAVSDDRKHVTLSDSLVQAGSFKLKGGGEIRRQEDHATIALDLSGSLSCKELAAANAESYLGRMIAPLARRAARDFLTGSVAVFVKIRADSRDLAAAKVLRTIGVGCGLRPLNLDDVVKLANELGTTLPGLVGLPPLPPLGSALPPLGSSLPPLGSALPPIPSGLPRIPSSLPPLPRLELPPARQRDAGAR